MKNLLEMGFLGESEEERAERELRERDALRREEMEYFKECLETGETSVFSANAFQETPEGNFYICRTKGGVSLLLKEDEYIGENGEVIRVHGRGSELARTFGVCVDRIDEENYTVYMAARYEPNDGTRRSEPDPRLSILYALREEYRKCRDGGTEFRVPVRAKAIIVHENYAVFNIGDCGVYGTLKNDSWQNGDDYVDLRNVLKNGDVVTVDVVGYRRPYAVRDSANGKLVRGEDGDVKQMTGAEKNEYSNDSSNTGKISRIERFELDHSVYASKCWAAAAYRNNVKPGDFIVVRCTFFNLAQMFFRAVAVDDSVLPRGYSMTGYVHKKENPYLPKEGEEFVAVIDRINEEKQLVRIRAYRPVKKDAVNPFDHNTK